MTSPAGEIWTIGHWTCAESLFLDTLLGADVDLLVDVRSHPGSRRSPQFNRDAMPEWLARAGIGYVHLPELGGRRPRQPDVPEQVNAGWQNRNFKNYADHTLSQAYEDGIAQLVDLAREHRVVLMCGEPMPWRCHRSLIANTLTARGWTVRHLSTTSAPRVHLLGAWGATPRVDDDGVVTYPPVPEEPVPAEPPAAAGH